MLHKKRAHPKEVKPGAQTTGCTRLLGAALFSAVKHAGRRVPVSTRWTHDGHPEYGGCREQNTDHRSKETKLPHTLPGLGELENTLRGEARHADHTFLIPFLRDIQGRRRCGDKDEWLPGTEKEEVGVTANGDVVPFGGNGKVWN